MRRAAHIDQNQPRIVAALLKVGCSVQSLAAVGCGVPDILAWSPHSRQLHLIEIKNPDRMNRSKDPITAAQKKFHAAWKGPIYIAETVGDALKIVDAKLPWEDGDD